MSPAVTCRSIAVAWLILFATALYAQESSQRPLAGKWVGQEIELTLEAEGDGYAGSMVFHGTTYAVTLGSDGRGFFEVEGDQFALTARRSGESLLVQSGTASIELNRADPPARRNPLEAAGAGEGDRAAGEPDGEPDREPAEAGWKTYRHPTGAYFEHPEGWRTQETPLGIALIPADFDPNAEVILAIGESADGIDGPTDPQVGQYFDLLMSQVAPQMRRTGGARPIACRAGTGARYEYSGRLNTGESAQARFYATVIGPHAVAIAVIATDERMKQRGPVVDRVFASLGRGEPKRDPALVGAWRTSTQESDASPAGSVVFRSDSTYTLEADGRITSQRRSFTGVTGEAGGTAQGRSEEAHAGTWSAADGRLFIAWEDGTATAASYEAGEGQLVVRPDGGERIVLRRAG